MSSNKKLNSFDNDAAHNNGSEEKLIDKLKQPTSFVIAILVCVILMLLCQQGSLQHEVTKMEKKLGGLGSQVSHLRNEEHSESKRMSTMQKTLSKIEKEEKELLKKEKDLEREEHKIMGQEKDHDRLIHEL